MNTRLRLVAGPALALAAALALGAVAQPVEAAPRATRSTSTLTATNVALNKTATGSTACATGEGPAKAVNGSVSGGLTDKFCSATSSRWLQIDLGASYSLSSFTVKHAGAGGESSTLNTKAFTIQTSPDGSTWTTRVTVTGNTASTTTHPITAATARYVRLNITTPTQTTDTAARIYELEAYGDPVTPPASGCTGTNGTDVTIPDNSTVESSLALTCSGNASATSSVEVHIKHTYIGDLVISLVAPDGTSYALQTNSGGGTDNLDKTFPVDLSSEAATGTWKLRVRDTASQDTGYIDTWTLNLGSGSTTGVGTFNVFDHLPQYGIYRSTDPSYTPPAGVLMWTHGTEYARKLTDAEKAKIGADVALRIKYHAQCDDYDRFASVFFISMPQGTAPTVGTQRVTLQDFISPFSDAWQGTKANYTYKDAPMGAYASALTNPDRDVWVGISGGSNPYSGDACDTHGVTDPAYKEVGFLYSLDLVSTQALTPTDRDVTGVLSRYGITTDTYTTTAVGNTADHGTGKLAISIAGYGAASGGEEYSNTTITVNALGREVARFSTAIDCAEYEQYSPRGNPGIFRNNTTSNPRSWCPGALVPTRFFDLGDIAGQQVSFTIGIGRKSPYVGDSQYRTSVALLES